MILTFLLFKFVGFCQEVDQDELQKKNLQDTILQKRTLLLRGSFDGMKALRQLFPGKYYELSKNGDPYRNKLINWSCNTCKPSQYPDENAMYFGGLTIESDHIFPYKEGVANCVKAKARML
jgi:hypothetical protein